MTEMINSKMNADEIQGFQTRGRKAMNGVLASLDDEDIFRQNIKIFSDEELGGKDVDSEYINTDDEDNNYNAN